MHVKECLDLYEATLGQMVNSIYKFNIVFSLLDDKEQYSNIDKVQAKAQATRAMFEALCQT